MEYTRTTEGGSLIFKNEKKEPVFEIREEIGDGEMKFFLKGELRNDFAFDLEDELISGLSVKKKISIDCGTLTFIAGAGLQSLLEAQHTADAADAEMVLINVKGAVRDVFRDNGFLDIFEIISG